MKKYLVYDLPTRVFHWLFAGLFVTAILIAKTIDDDSFLFPFHMMAGLTLGILVWLRIIWGFVGSRYAKFSSFALHPKSLIEYFKGFLSDEKHFWPGHNPASSWAALAMMLLALGLGMSGFLMASGQKEAFEDVHELAANAFIVIAVMHVLGVMIHTIRHKDIIGLSMINGHKAHINEADSIGNQHPLAALVMIVMVGLYAGYLYTHYDANTGKLNLFGQQLSLAEPEDDVGATEESD